MYMDILNKCNIYLHMYIIINNYNSIMICYFKYNYIFFINEYDMYLYIYIIMPMLCTIFQLVIIFI